MGQWDDGVPEGDADAERLDGGLGVDRISCRERSGEKSEIAPCRRRAAGGCHDSNNRPPRHLQAVPDPWPGDNETGPPSGIEADYIPHGKVSGFRSDGLPNLKLAVASFP